MELQINKEIGVLSKTQSINTLRFLAAFQVMWGHMISHLDVTASTYLGQNLIAAITNILQYFNGVPLFFFLSGFLNYFSIKKSKSAKEFFEKKFWRIYPELWVGVIIEIFTIFVFYKGRIEWPQLGVFFIAQATIFQFWTPDCLRAYGCGTPNGSLWTVGITIQFYILSWLTRKFWSGRKLRFWVVSISLLMLAGAATGTLEKYMAPLLYKLYCQTIVQYLWVFWIGLLAAEYADKIIPVLKKYWWVFVISFILWRLAGIDLYARNYPVFMVTIACFGCLGLAYAFPGLNIKLDISYAIFIYHMIFVNVMIAVRWIGFRGMVIAIIITFIISYLSTGFIGKKDLWKIHWEEK